MDGKPVPYVQRGSKKYIVDHHHTLVALELSGLDVDITLEQIRSFDKAEQSLEGFWGYLEGRGWAFLRDEQYARIPIDSIPKTFAISAFRNDVYRSMGGFARVYGVLKRGKELDDRLFFEFRWGYMFWLRACLCAGSPQSGWLAGYHSWLTLPPCQTGTTATASGRTSAFCAVSSAACSWCPRLTCGRTPTRWPSPRWMWRRSASCWSR